MHAHARYGACIEGQQKDFFTPAANRGDRPLAEAELHLPGREVGDHMPQCVVLHAIVERSTAHDGECGRGISDDGRPIGDSTGTRGVAHRRHHHLPVPVRAIALIPSIAAQARTLRWPAVISL